MSKELTQTIDSLYQRVREILDTARNKVYQTVNLEMLHTGM